MSQPLNSPQPDVVLYPNPVKMAGLAIGALVFVLLAPVVWKAGFLMKLFAVADVLFFGYAFIYAVGRLVKRTPSLIVDARGVTDNGSALAAGFIPWEEIASAAVIPSAGKRWLAVFPHDPQVLLARQPSVKRKLMETNLKTSGSPVLIPGHTSLSLEEMLAPIQAHLAARQQSWPPSPILHSA